VGDAEEVLRAHVLAATEVVRDRHRVVVVGGVDKTAATADVEHEGDVGLREGVPEAVEVGMRRCTVAGRRVGDHDRGGAALDRLGGERHRPSGVDQRHVGDAQQAGVTRAEGVDGAVLRGRAGVEALRVATGVQRAGEGREHQLTVDAHQVERARALGDVEGAHRVPALVLPQPLLGGGRLPRIAPAGFVLREGVVEDRLHPVEGAEAEQLPLVVFDEAVEEVRQLHHMAVGVEHDAVCDRHGDPPG
jgi:hypothetical protein